MRRAVVAALASAFAALASCANIVGIDDAQLDPTLAGGASASGGASSGGAGGVGAISGAGGGDDPHAILCGRYCAAVMKNCTGAVQVYESPLVCLRVCEALEAGRPNDRAGNTINCRLFHANQIEVIGERETECPAAGPGGDGVCGQNCEGYCSLLTGLCPAELSVECGASCPSVEDLGGYASSQTSGKTLQCRLYHVSAATIDPVFHCPHAAGAGPCSM